MECIITADVVVPYGDRPTDGQYSFEVVLSPMADAAFKNESWSDVAVEVCRVMERALRESEAIETESLCILAGAFVWNIKVAVHVLDNGGNLFDAAAAAALASLLHYRRPSVTVDKGVVQYRPDESGAPLSIHHSPVSVTFGFLAETGTCSVLSLLDPSAEEAAVLSGFLSVAINDHGELCSVQKSGGCAVEPDVLLRCIELASIRAKETLKLIRESVRESHAITGVPPKRNLLGYLMSPENTM